MTELENSEAGVNLCCRVPKGYEGAGLAHISKFHLLLLHNLSSHEAPRQRFFFAFSFVAITKELLYLGR